jgi:hypothetical protein
LFQGLINNAKSAAGSVVAKYATRTSVAVPFVVALGFATAGITLMLIERFGHREAYFMIAGGFLAIGLVAALIVRTKEQDEAIAEEKAGQEDTADVATDAAAAAAAQMPLALLGTLFTSPAGPTSVLGLARLLGRNLPLVVLLVAMGVLFWPKPTGETETEADAGDVRQSNGAFPSQELPASI